MKRAGIEIIGQAIDLEAYPSALLDQMSGLAGADRGYFTEIRFACSSVAL